MRIAGMLGLLLGEGQWRTDESGGKAGAEGAY
jgi:hypothetical protein